MVGSDDGGTDRPFLSEGVAVEKLYRLCGVMRLLVQICPVLQFADCGFDGFIYFPRICIHLALYDFSSC